MKTRPWITVNELDHPHSVDAQDAVLAASHLLFQLSGQKYAGVQETTEQYMCETTGAPIGCTWDPGVRGFWNPAIGMYVYTPPQGLRSLLGGQNIILRGTPVVHVLSVSIDGVVKSPSDYHILDNKTLELGGNWGLCDRPVVNYTFGVAPPAMGRMAARRLANELILAADNSAECKLPSNVQSVTRGGLSLDIFDPQAFLEKGRTGLYEVDLFIATVNPGQAKKRPRVFTPDLPRGYRRRGGAS